MSAFIVASNTAYPANANESSSPEVENLLCRIRALDRKITDGMSASAERLRDMLNDIDIACETLPRSAELLDLEEYRSFHCKILFVRLVALHLSTKLTHDQMLWWTR